MDNALKIELSTLFQLVSLSLVFIAGYINLRIQIVKLQAENEATKERLTRKDKYDDDLRKKVDEIYNLLLNKK